MESNIIDFLPSFPSIANLIFFRFQGNSKSYVNSLRLCDHLKDAKLFPIATGIRNLPIFSRIESIKHELRWIDYIFFHQTWM